ncbi:MAG TPA: acetyl-CoA C-acetyltransferase [Alphaproteobacteria bacterium]|nr:acetyl-CoA C-acetyltransferase [Rhodospirillaceae bacterium]HRJ11905.1 acetyl-CoA C-acetyltransferase [Alphaproteobacteria bacterium]
MSDIVIVSAARTPIGAFNGAFANVPAHELGRIAAVAALEKAGIKPDEVDEMILGQVLTATAGMNPARQTAIAAGIPNSKTAMTINQVCGSGLRAVALGMQQIQTGAANIVVAGGQENMTLSPHAMALRAGVKMGNGTLIDTMIHDGLTDIFNNYHMGITAENVAKEFGITREQQDEFAANSQNKAEAAMAAGAFKKEIAPVTIKNKKGDIVVDKDEYPRAGVTAESLSGLRPAFDKEGTVTAGNASGINDGAAVVVLMRADEAKKRGLKALARIASWATAGVDPKVMGTGPIPASQQALQNAGWTVNDLDLIESNEAFAAQACAVNKAMNFPAEKTNVNGGAIALGHPIGASGARVLVTLLHALEARGGKRGLATLCIGGGMGIALCVERT